MGFYSVGLTVEKLDHMTAAKLDAPLVVLSVDYSDD